MRSPRALPQRLGAPLIMGSTEQSKICGIIRLSTERVWSNMIKFESDLGGAAFSLLPDKLTLPMIPLPDLMLH